MFIPKESERVKAVLTEQEIGILKITWLNIFIGEYSEQGSKNWSGWKEVISARQYQDPEMIIGEVSHVLWGLSS